MSRSNLYTAAFGFGPRTQTDRKQVKKKFQNPLPLVWHSHAINGEKRPCLYYIGADFSRKLAKLACHAQDPGLGYIYILGNFQ